MTDGEAEEPFASEEAPADSDDADILEYYSEGNLRSGSADPGRIRRLKDVGYLMCTVDMDTGLEYLKTTSSGSYGVLLTNPLDADESDEARRRMREILGRR